ncbi:MAG TPA: hypothetical protein VGP06_00720 [Janthinobacterium sp.]|jgi:hypothetical protein|nr:hypothetical protein [Janthinobacterium sp.]
MTQTDRTQGTGFKPRFAALAAAYPGKSVMHTELFEEIGIGELANRPECQPQRHTPDG